MFVLFNPCARERSAKWVVSDKRQASDGSLMWIKIGRLAVVVIARSSSAGLGGHAIDPMRRNAASGQSRVDIE